MKLFSRLFTEALPSPPTLQDRIAELTTAEAELVFEAPNGAEEPALRLAAVRRLPDGQTLRTLAALTGPLGATSGSAAAEVEQAAQARIAELVDEGGVEFGDLCSQAVNRSALLAVAAVCRDSARLRQALESIDDPRELAQLVVGGFSSRLRRCAAEAIDDPGELRELLKQVRGKDKTVYRILKHKSDTLHALDRRAAERAGEVEALCASLERHSHRSFDVSYGATLERLAARWRALTPRPDASSEDRAQQAIEHCRQVVAEQLRKAAEQAASIAAERTVREAHEQAREAASAAAAAQAAAEAQRQEEAAAALAAEEAARMERRAAQERLGRQLGGLIRLANGALRTGNTQKAAGLRRAIAAKWPDAPSIPLPLARQLQHLDDKLDELKQWKDYAVAPKRIELIERMEALIGSTDEPAVLAQHIKALQEDWRTISQGIASEATEEWERFHRASQSAYQPCRIYFEAQATLRRDNLERRRALLERLKAFEASQSIEEPDWRRVARVLREAPQEWRECFPVDREANRALQADFDATVSRLKSRLDARFEHNAAEKQTLIERARQLLVREDGREALDEVKRLQSLWKDVGPVSRDREQPLWSAFREACDAIYQRRQQAFAEYAAALDAAKAKAVALCAEAERCAALTGPALTAAGGNVSELRAAFDALGELPRADARGLRDRFERALASCALRLAEQRARDVERSVADLIEAGRYLRMYEWAVVQNAGAAERQMRRQEAEAFIAGVPHWPKGGLEAVNEMLVKSASRTATDSESGEKALRLLCIRGEILSETSTPDEDQGLRREYQVQRLMQAMGQGSRPQDGDWDAMALDWIRVGAVPPTVYGGLQIRFKRCVVKRTAVRHEPPTLATEPVTGKPGDSRRGAGRPYRSGRDGAKFVNTK
jgi:hypothetical protein